MGDLAHAAQLVREGSADKAAFTFYKGRIDFRPGELLGEIEMGEWRLVPAPEGQGGSMEGQGGSMEGGVPAVQEADGITAEEVEEGSVSPLLPWPLGASSPAVSSGSAPLAEDPHGRQRQRGSYSQRFSGHRC